MYSISATRSRGDRVSPKRCPPLPRPTEPVSIQAGCENGVLTLRIPVAEAAKPRKVEISASGENKSTAIPAQSTSS